MKTLYAPSLIEGAPIGNDNARGPHNMSGLPARTADTMSDAIALSSPNGRMSKTARAAANKKLSTALFGKSGLKTPSAIQPSERTSLLRQAKELRDLAARGMSTKKYLKKAAELEKQAGG